MMKRLRSQVLMLTALFMVGTLKLTAQCAGPLVIAVQGSGTGLPLSASETHLNAQCPGDNGAATISAMGGTSPYFGTGTYVQAVGTHVYTVVDFVGCTSSVSVTIISNHTRPTGAISGTTTSCSGSPVTLTLSVVGSGLITGTLSNGTPFSGMAPTITVTVSPTMTTTYTIATMSDNFCTSIAADLTGSATVTVINCTEISGKLIWEGNRLTLMSGVNGATVNLTGDDTDSEVTGIPGTYSLSADMGTNFVVKPVKNKPMPTALNGVTAADASRIQMHIANLPPLNDPYKVIAADVNKNNAVSNADVSIITDAILGVPAAQAFFINTTWRFVPKSHVFPNPNAPWGFPDKIIFTGVGGGNLVGQDFIGAKLGDVNNTANPVNSPNSPAPELTWKVQDQFLEQDEMLTVTFEAENFEAILALQFGLQFDPLKLDLLSVEPVAGSLMQVNNFGLYHKAIGEVRALLAMTETKSMADGAPAFKLKFKSLQGGGKLSEALYLSDAVLLGEAYTGDFTPGPVELVYESIVSGTNELESANFKLLQNRPNPFQDVTTIGFVLPDACEAQIRVYDSNGRLIASQKGSVVRGYNELEIHLEKYTGSGALYYELVTPFGVLSKKMTIAQK